MRIPSHIPGRPFLTTLIVLAEFAAAFGAFWLMGLWNANDLSYYTRKRSAK